MEVCKLPTGTENVLYIVSSVGFPVLTSISNGDWYTSSSRHLVILCEGNERDMPAVLTKQYKNISGKVFFVFTAVLLLNFTELTCWNTSNIHAALSELFSTSLYLNNSMSCTLNLCKPSICFLIDRNYLTINISGAGRVSTNHLPAFISGPPTTCALVSFSKVSFFPQLQYTLFLASKRVWSLNISQHSLVTIS